MIDFRFKSSEIKQENNLSNTLNYCAILQASTSTAERTRIQVAAPPPSKFLHPRKSRELSGASFSVLTAVKHDACASFSPRWISGCRERFFCHGNAVWKPSPVPFFSALLDLKSRETIPLNSRRYRELGENLKKFCCHLRLFDICLVRNLNTPKSCQNRIKTHNSFQIRMLNLDLRFVIYGRNLPVLSGNRVQ